MNLRRFPKSNFCNKVTPREVFSVMLVISVIRIIHHSQTGFNSISACNKYKPSQIGFWFTLLPESSHISLNSYSFNFLFIVVLQNVKKDGKAFNDVLWDETARNHNIRENKPVNSMTFVSSSSVRQFLGDNRMNE